MGYVVAACVANILSFVAGTALTWSSPMLVHMEREDESPFGRVLTVEELAWITSMLPVGAMIGPYLFGILAARRGRKTTLIICGIPFIVSFLLFAWSTVTWTYYIGRFLIGMCIGGVFTIMPTYIAEISAPEYRGTLGTSINCFICFGFFFSHAAGSYLSILAFNLILAAFPIIFIVVFIFVASETPHFYVLKNKEEKARAVLKTIRHEDDENIESDLKEMQERVKEQHEAGYIDIFKSKGLLKAFGMSVGLLGFQQFSGINAVLFYAEDIFISSGSSLEPKICAIIIGSTQFVTSFSTPLFVDRLGRRILLLISAVGIIISQVTLGIYFFFHEKKDKAVTEVAILPVVCLAAYIISFNAGLAILPWSIMGELFPNKVRTHSSSACTSITWFVGFFIVRYFQPLSEALGMSVLFWAFAGFTALLIPFTWFFVIETKNKTLIEIQDELRM